MCFSIMSVPSNFGRFYSADHQVEELVVVTTFIILTCPDLGNVMIQF